MGTNIADAKAAMAIIKGRIKSEMSIMMGDLEKDRVLWQSLARKLGRAEKAWAEVENHYTHILTVVDEEEAEGCSVTHKEFQTQFLTLLDRVQDAIDKAKDEEDALAEADSRVSRVRLLGERWGSAYHHIETVLGELQTRLGGDPIDNLELLEVKSAQVTEIKAQISSAATLVNAMLAADPDQTEVTLEVQAMRRAAAEVKVHQCEELMTTMKVVINARNAATVEAVAATTAAAEVVEVPAARMKITPKFERQSLPDFTSGKLRKFPMFKKDWLELVSDRYDPTHELRLIRKCVPSRSGTW